MATVTKRVVYVERPTVLRKIPYHVYETLRNEPANDHLRMTYYDGTLEITSPQYVHERPSERLSQFVVAVAVELEIPFLSSGSTTIKKPGDGPKKGKGKEPDRSFYLGNLHRVLNNTEIDLEVDPPPDLWIETDNRASSAGRLPLYAALGVPEVWRYRVRKKTLWFGRLVDGAYQAVERSDSLPMLTPALVLESLALGEEIDDTTWNRRLRDWIRERLATS